MLRSQQCHDRCDYHIIIFDRFFRIERQTRSRRSANSWDHYVEVLVVADSKMHEYHGYNLESYILTLFSTVASIYRHQSLRASINVVVVKIIILKHENVSWNFKQSYGIELQTKTAL
ncbi:hypothetical protein ANCDUO_03130 [Ancylostoma duodenale]|uniref:Uncharacterized protein n=1 Tax=Ancylostoma duodenale TaxID=51022 RepID=A0A0C2H4S1_9BILA|nr:hypothetical protein ANCDUO_03130 [Ancylostoma duodenale]